ncbi:MAG: DUF1573 domain-containing protein [Lentisphaeraceae bacterium]|nr:DUF1573 domain-containing protein [Lentisphaeraceae bacterium]
MKYLIYILCFCAANLYAESLVWTKTELDIKTTSSKEKYEASFEYKNTSNKTINFVKIKASCGCIVLDKPEKVEPGESGKITFKAPIPYGGGSYTKSISVDTDETKEVEYKLSFKVTNTDPYVPRKPKQTQKIVRNNDSKVPGTSVIPVKKLYFRPQKLTPRALLVEKLMAKQALARKKAYHIQEECPFLPLPINKKLYFDYNGLRIYTCCEQCLILVKESPHHAIIKLAEKTQTPTLIKDLTTAE